MAVKTVTRYITTDGTEFSSASEANIHENKKTDELLEKSVQEDISKILIKLKDLKRNENSVYLWDLKDFLSKLLTKDGTETLNDRYYSSSYDC